MHLEGQLSRLDVSGSSEILNPNAFGGDYIIIPKQEGEDAFADFILTDLAAGTYVILATWPEHESRTYRAEFVSFVSNGTATTETLLAQVNQRFSPEGDEFGGVPWQGIAMITVALDVESQTHTITDSRGNILGILGADNEFVIHLNGGTKDITGNLTGNLAVDAIRFERAVLPSLTMLDLRGNVLDTAAHEYVLDGLRSIRPGDYASITDDIETPLNEGLLYSSTSEMGTIQGAKWNDLNGNAIWDEGELGLSGWTIFLDQNHNGILDSGESWTTTNTNGSYSFTNLDAGLYFIAEEQQEGWEQSYPSGLLSTYEDEIIEDGPRGYWRLGESSTLDPAADLSGNNFNGSYHGALGLGSTGALPYDDDTAIEFIGYNTDDFVSLPHEVLNGLGDATIEFWMNHPGSTGVVTGTTIFDAADGAGNALRLMMEYSVVDHPGLRVSGQGTTITWSFDNTNPETSFAYNQWHHIVLIRNATNDTYELYVDGESQGSRSYVIGDLSVAEGGFLIGQRQGGVIGVGSDENQAFIGKLDEFAIYDRILTSGDIAEHYSEESLGYLFLGHVVDLNDNPIYDNFNFGNWEPADSSSIISGTVYDDINGDGTRTLDEPGIEGWTIFLDQEREGVYNQAYDTGELVTVTDYYGYYSFTGLTPGIEYHVTELLENGWISSSGIQQTVFLPSNGAITIVDFGNHQILDITGPGEIVSEGSDITLAADILDSTVATHNLSYVWSVTTTNGQDTSGIISTTSSLAFTADDDGIYTVTLTVTDHDDTDQQYISVLDVFVTNIPPLVTLGGPYTKTEGETVDFSGAIVDPDRLTSNLIVAWTVYDEFDQVVDSSTDADHEFTVPNEGVYRVSVTVNDGDADPVTEEVLVTASNAPPVLTSTGGPYTITEGNSLPLNSSATDAGQNDILIYLWDLDYDGEFGDVTGQTPLLTWEQLVAFGIDDYQATPYTIGLRVQDDFGDSDTASTEVTVQNKNPEFQGDIVGPTTGSEGDLLIGFSVPAATDPGDEILMYEWDFDYDGITFVPDPTATGQSVDHLFVQDGTFTVAVRVQDDEGGEAIQSMGDVVTISNCAPVVEVGEDREVNEGDTVTLSGTFTDLGTDDSHTYLWEVCNSQEEVIDSATGDVISGVIPQFDFTPTNGGIYTITLTITDDSGDSASESGQDSLTVAVNNVTPYNISIVGPTSEFEGIPINLDATYEDPGTEDSHTYRWEAISSNGQLIAPDEGDVTTQGVVPQFSFTPVDDGIYWISLTISDDVDSSTQIHQIIVNNADPVLNPIDDVVLSDIDDLLVLTGTFTDVLEDSHTATVSFSNGISLPIVVHGTSFDVEYQFSSPGIYQATVTLIDDDGGESIESFQVTVDRLFVHSIDISTDSHGVVDEITIQFSEPVNWVAPHNVPVGLTLTRDGEVLRDGIDFPWNPVQYLLTDNHITWTLKNLNIGGLTSVDGTYSLILDEETAGITTVSGNHSLGYDVEEAWTLDNTAPLVTIDHLVTNDTTPTIHGTVNDTTATIMVGILGEFQMAIVNLDGTWNLSGSMVPSLTDGTYDVIAIVIDPLGNDSVDNTINELIIDTVLPAVSVTPLETEDSTPALNGTIDDPDATIKVVIDCHQYAAENNGDGTWVLADNVISEPLAPGTYDVQVTATDMAGNMAIDNTIDELTILVTLPADFDSDGDVDSYDLDIWEGGFRTTTGAGLHDGDADGDGDVDGTDFLAWQLNFGSTSSSGLASTCPTGLAADEGGSRAFLSKGHALANIPGDPATEAVGLIRNSVASNQGNSFFLSGPRDTSQENINFASWSLPQPTPATNGNTTNWLGLPQFQSRDAARPYHRDRAVDAVMSGLDMLVPETDLDRMPDTTMDDTRIDFKTMHDRIWLTDRVGKRSVPLMNIHSSEVEDRSDLETALEELKFKPMFRNRENIRV